MASYYISGVWKDTAGTITHYAFHAVHADGKFTTKSTKTDKVDAIKLVEASANTVTTLVWGYTSAKWQKGETVSIAKNGTDKYLRTTPDNKLNDNLGHLICWNCFIP